MNTTPTPTHSCARMRDYDQYLREALIYGSQAASLHVSNKFWGSLYVKVLRAMSKEEVRSVPSGFESTRTYHRILKSPRFKRCTSAKWQPINRKYVMSSKSKFIPAPSFSSHVFPETLKFRVSFILFPLHALYIRKQRSYIRTPPHPPRSSYHLSSIYVHSR